MIQIGELHSQRFTDEGTRRLSEIQIVSSNLENAAQPLVNLPPRVEVNQFQEQGEEAQVPPREELDPLQSIGQDKEAQVLPRVEPNPLQLTKQSKESPISPRVEQSPFGK